LFRSSEGRARSTKNKSPKKSKRVFEVGFH
jgi:hypothetical protein